MTDAESRIVREKAMQYCCRREYCRKEIFEKAVSWGCTSAKANELVDYLVEHKFVDERRYTEAFVKDKLRFNKWGRIKISYMLHLQNIDRNMIMSVFSEIDEIEYNKILTEELQKKMKSLRGNQYEIKAKLFRFASSRGFESDIVNRVIYSMLEK